jgi:hypothetical protein
VTRGLFGLPSRAVLLRRSATLLEERTAKDSPFLDFVNWWRPEFDDYEIHLIDVLPPATGGANINVAMRCSIDGGASYDTGNNYSWIHKVWVVAGTGTAGANGTNYISLSVMGSANANWGASGVFQFSNPAGARYKQVHGTNVAHDATKGATDVELSIVAGAYLNARQVNALRFLVSAGTQGNLASGTIRIYGVAK